MKKSERLNLLKELVTIFSSNIVQYKSSSYDEANTRIDFIDKFFTLLGWDVSNNSGFAESYRDVVREDKVKIEGNQKAPDYSFRIGGIRKYFLEAKKPSVNIKEEINPAFQIRRYGYTAKLPISVLTDFEEFAIYDTRIKPVKNDKANVARLFYCKFTEYENHFDFIYETLSKESILKGSFDKYVNDQKNKRGTGEVDKDLLCLIETWRADLAKNIAVRNQSIDVYNLNLAVQKIIDRIIFLRIAEDRDIEEYATLLTIANKKDIYAKLNVLFNKANLKFNSGLFKNEQWLSRLQIDDKIFADIITGLYYPDCPYVFSILPIEILGNIYEQFLGKVILLKPTKSGHTAYIDEKPEVKKAGGVFYTPQYIVNYIITKTISERLKNKPLSIIESIRICDPACGSGSFLVGAYQLLLEIYLEHYSSILNLKAALKSGKVYQASSNSIKLSISEKQKILTTNIYGVDIDPQAVEVTKLSLYLKLLEGESSEAQGSLFKHSDLKMLPTLDSNIKCGNSLIDNSYYENDQSSLFEINEIRSINAFDWEKEFPDIFKKGGFDCIVGNPPYVDVKILDENVKNTLIRKYESASKRFDLYIPFVEKSLTLINKNGVVSFIMPSMFLIRDYGLGLRTYLSKNAHAREIIHFGTNQIFENAMNYVGIFTLDCEMKKQTDVCKFIDCNFNGREIEQVLNGELSVDKKIQRFTLKSTDFKIGSEWHLHDPNERNLMNLFKIHKPLNNFLECASEGIHSGKDEVFFLTEDNFIKDSIVYKLAKGKDVHKYENVDNKKFKKWVIYPYNLTTGDVIEENEMATKHPAVYAYLKSKRSDLKGRPYFDKSSKLWYELWCQRSSNLYLKPKILGPEITDTGNFTLSRKPLFINNKLKSLVPKSKNAESIEYLLGVLNSSLLVYLHRMIAPPKGNNYFEVKTAILSKLPIKTIDFKIPFEKDSHDNIVKHVNGLLNISQQIDLANTDHDVEIFKKQYNVKVQQIDAIVFKLYGLSKDEINTVEGNTKSRLTADVADARMILNTTGSRSERS